MSQNQFDSWEKASEKVGVLRICYSLVATTMDWTEEVIDAPLTAWSPGS